ncbi:MarR family winged helix-turn-helix transcriptional regulator [Modestobacter sp. VKM Ac-2978]|uniref:MarR family winged helix-turn-helix transcriptional regulator n=1 Tax=Modestobacter sp. VKM Ac-2978 TaxID=3004132 RepID=UPI0022AAB025|nr:MarR family winged helix-turn-helix transcriptional regulator [Modestobacter sp. VKM Ac-2978]MCZ2850238.1 MarR family winged helix-turn-helix transcriptional regulator [Modestobacter sp. VKM Ac-2978]
MEEPVDGVGPGTELPPWLADDPAGIPAYALARAGAAVNALFSRQLASVGLRPHTFVVLVHLARARTLTSAELARRLQLTPQSMSTLLHGLVDAGWVERPGPVRRGQKSEVHLTEAGHRALLAAGPVLAELGRPAVLGLTEQEAATLHGLLERVLAAVQPPPGVGRDGGPQPNPGAADTPG